MAASGKETAVRKTMPAIAQAIDRGEQASKLAGSLSANPKVALGAGLAGGAYGLLEGFLSGTKKPQMRKDIANARAKRGPGSFRD